MRDRPYPSANEVREDLAAVRSRVMRATRRRVWRVPVIIAFGTLLLGGSAASIAAVIIERVNNDTLQHSVRCFESDSLSSHFMDAGTSPATPKTGSAIAQPAVVASDACAALWRAGLIGQTQPPEDPATADLPVPLFAVCRLTSGQLAAFPRVSGEESAVVCSRVGVAPATE